MVRGGGLGEREVVEGDEKHTGNIYRCLDAEKSVRFDYSAVATVSQQII